MSESSSTATCETSTPQQSTKAYTEVTDKKRKAAPLHITLTVKRYARHSGAKGGKGYVRPGTPIPDGFAEVEAKLMEIDQASFDASVRKMHSLISDLHNKIEIGFPDTQIMEPRQPPTVEDVLSVQKMEERYGELPEGRDSYLRMIRDEYTNDRLRMAELEKRRKNYHRHYKAGAHDTRETVVAKLRDRYLSVKAECMQHSLTTAVEIIQ